MRQAGQAQGNRLAVYPALLAFALFIIAANDFRPANGTTLLASAALETLAGAVALALAARASRSLPPLGQPLAAPLDRGRHFGWAAALVGALLLLALAETNVHITALPLPALPTWAQFAVLVLGMTLLAWGLGGAPGLRFRIAWRPLLPLAAILALALFLRLWQQGVTQRALVDELHFSDGILALERDPAIGLLTPMSTVSPFPWIFPYGQSWAVALLGHNFVGFRFASAILGTLTVLAAYGLARALFDRKTALLAALLLATFPPHVHFSRTAIIQIADPLFGTLALLFLVRALRLSRRLDWALAGVSLGLTQYFYEGARLLFPPLVLAFVVLLAVRGGLRGKGRGLALTLLAALIAAAPVYYVLLGEHHTLTGRYDVSGESASYWQNLSGAHLTEDTVIDAALHFAQPFLLYVSHPDASTDYGGDQPLVLEYFVPLFLFGCFYLLWRYPSPAFVIPLWIAATALGNGLLTHPLVSSRYVEVLPALALALAAGLRYGLAFFVPDSRRYGRFLLILLAGVIATAQVGYYFGPHLALFKVQIRAEKDIRDGIDAVLRAAELPGNTQIILISKPENDQIVTRHWLSFLARDGDPGRYFPLLAVTPDTISPKYLLDLPEGVNYAFFVDPNDVFAIGHIERYFPNVQPPQYSTADLPANREYVLLYAPFTPK